MAADAKPSGSFNLPTLLSYLILFYNTMADTKIAAQCRHPSYRINILAMQIYNLIIDAARIFTTFNKKRDVGSNSHVSFVY